MPKNTYGFGAASVSTSAHLPLRPVDFFIFYIVRFCSHKLSTGQGDKVLNSLSTRTSSSEVRASYLTNMQLQSLMSASMYRFDFLYFLKTVVDVTADGEQCM